MLLYNLIAEERTMKKQAFWRGKHVDSQTTRYALWEIIEGKPVEIEALHGYSTWDTPKAVEASAPIERRIEKEAEDLGYEIIRNPID